MVLEKEVLWIEPPNLGSRTQYSVESVADRRKVMTQLEEYVSRGYLEEVSVSDLVFLSPLLPIRKPNGSFRFTNDFRYLNAYFSKSGMCQVDVKRHL